jgi:hypothetical protein
VGNVNPSCKPLHLDSFSAAPPRVLYPRGQGGAAGATEEVIVQYPEHPALGPIVVGPIAPPLSGEAVAAAAAAIAAEAEAAGAETEGAAAGEEAAGGGGGGDRPLGYRAIKASWIYPKEGEDLRYRAALQRTALEGIRFVEKVASSMAGGRAAMVSERKHGRGSGSTANICCYWLVYMCSA